MLIASSTTQGFSTWPEIWNSLVPLLFSRPKLANQRRRGAGSWRDRDALDIVDRGRAAIEPRAGRERRLEARLALLALQALDHRGLFAADIGARAAVEEDVEVVARAAGVLAEQPGVIGLVDGFWKVSASRMYSPRM